MFSGKLFLVVVACLVVSTSLPTAPAFAQTSPPAELGLQEISLQNQGEKMQWDIRVKKTPRCMFGDFDAIGLEMLASPPDKTKLLMTVEGFRANDLGARFVQDITRIPPDVDFEKEGFKVTANLPTSSELKILGLYICKDMAGAESCASKRANDIMGVLNQYQTNAGAENLSIPTDKIYYFKMVILDGNRLYYPTESLNQYKYEKLQDWLASRKVEQKVLAFSLDRVRHFNSIIGSLSRKPVQSRELEVILPQYAANKCQVPGKVPVAPR